MNMTKQLNFYFHLSIVFFPKKNCPFPDAVIRILTLHLYLVLICDGFSLVSMTLDYSSTFHYSLFAWSHNILMNANLPESSSRVTIWFWLIRRSNFLDNLGEIFLGAPDLFCLHLCFKPFNRWTHRIKRNIKVAWDISITFTIFPMFNNQCF